MSEQKTEQLYKFTLPCGMIVLLREPRISHTTSATKIAGKGAGDNQAYLGARIQEEMCKMLVHSVGKAELKNDDGEVIQEYVDPVRIPRVKLETLDNVFKNKQYAQVIQCISKINGLSEDEMGNEPVMELLTTGAQ